jgi:hypothetical protein
MSFDDLPEGWQDRPLDGDQLIEDVLDLFISMRDRYAGTLLVLLCDKQRRLVQSVLVEEIQFFPPPDMEGMFGNLVRAVEEVGEDLGVLVALARPGSLRVRPSDDAWARIVTRGCAGRLPLLGMYLVTPRGSVPIRADPLVA